MPVACFPAVGESQMRQHFFRYILPRTAFLGPVMGFEEADPAQQGKKVSGGHFFRPGENP